MALYQILETPGKRLVYPLPDDDLEEGEKAHTPLRSQDDAKMEIARLRGIARAEGRKVDFVAVPIASSTNGRAANGAGAASTSLRLTEDNRRRLAQFVGLRMYETGEPISMSDAVALLVDHYEATKAFAPTNPDFEGNVLEEARRIRRAQKEAADA